MVEIKEKDIQKAAAEGMDSFLRIFTDSYKAALLGELTSDKMGALNGDQHTLLAYPYTLNKNTYDHQ